jgi:hypothetical protein
VTNLRDDRLVARHASLGLLDVDDFLNLAGDVFVVRRRRARIYQSTTY